MYRRLTIPYTQYRHPELTLNAIKPMLYAIQVISDLQANGEWTHTQRNKFNFVIAELMLSIANAIKDDSEPNHALDRDNMDIPF